ncbi:hypothetical protein A2U01_0066550, partial [Trifolium medium]|nr:hypothetical protein [Trifolium medium]
MLARRGLARTGENKSEAKPHSGEVWRELASTSPRRPFLRPTTHSRVAGSVRGFIKNPLKIQVL